MEIKAKLDKPYTNKEKLDFIVKYNHNQGFIIEETKTELLALGLDEKEIKENKITQFEKEFFKTSLGYIKREVTMKEGGNKSFLGDLLPLLKTGAAIIAYDKPDFDKEIENEDILELQKKVIVTDEFLKECQNQVIIDFYGIESMALLDKIS